MAIRAFFICHFESNNNNVQVQAVRVVVFTNALCFLPWVLSCYVYECLPQLSMIVTGWTASTMWWTGPCLGAPWVSVPVASSPLCLRGGMPLRALRLLCNIHYHYHHFYNADYYMYYYHYLSFPLNAVVFHIIIMITIVVLPIITLCAPPSSSG